MNCASIGVIASSYRSVSFDTNTQTYITAAGITDTTQKNAINALVLAAKANGWWTLCSAIYPVPNSTQSACQVNLKSPGTFDLTFNGGWSFASTGMTPNGTTGYANTGIIPSTHLTQDDTHLSIYSRSATDTGNEYDIGVQTGGSVYMALRLDIYQGFQYSSSFDMTTYANVSTSGFYLDSRTSSALQETYKNGVFKDDNITSTITIPTTNSIYIGALNSSGIAAFFSTKEYAFASIGAGINSTIAALIYSDIQTFRTTLNLGQVADTDAQAFITAAGIVESTQQSAINTLVVAAKANGWWSLCNAIYPMVGPGSAHVYNLKDPRDLDIAFRLTFNGLWSHSFNGSTPDGSTGYADTHLIPASVLTNFSTHISIYSRTNFDENIYDMGSSNGSVELSLTLRGGNFLTSRMTSASSGAVSTSNTDSAAFFIATRTSNSLHSVYRNSSLLGSNSTSVSDTLPTTYPIYIGASNLDGTDSFHSTKECSFATIGSGINSTIAALMYTDIQTFNTSLARQV